MSVDPESPNADLSALLTDVSQYWVMSHFLGRSGDSRRVGMSFNALLKVSRTANLLPSSRLVLTKCLLKSDVYDYHCH